MFLSRQTTTKMLEWNQQSKLTFFEWGGKHNKFKPKSQNMQSRIKNQELWQKISLSTQNPNLKPKLNQSKHPLKKNPKFIGLNKKKILLLLVALWPSTTNHPHRKPTTANQNLTILNPHHGTTTNTTREKTQTLQCWSTPKPTNHHLPTPWRRYKDHEREREREREGKDSNVDPHQKSTRRLRPSSL